MQLFKQRIARHDAWWSNELVKAAERVEAVRQELIESSGEDNGSENNSSSLSTVSSSRCEGLEDDW